MTNPDILPGLGIELKIDGRIIMKPTAKSVDGQYQQAWGYREGRYLTPLGEIGLQYVQYKDEDSGGKLIERVLIDCSKAEVIQQRYSWMGELIGVGIKKDGRGSVKLQSGWGGSTHLNVRLEGRQAKEPVRSHWIKAEVELPRTLAGPNGYRHEWQPCPICSRGYGHIKH